MLTIAHRPRHWTFSSCRDQISYSINHSRLFQLNNYGDSDDSLALQETGSIETQQQTGTSLDEYKQKYRQDAISTMVWSSALILLHIVPLVFAAIGFSELFRSLLFIMGVVGFAGGIWEYYRARRLTLVDLHKHNEAQEFTKSVEKTPITYTKAVLACLIVVAGLER